MGEANYFHYRASTEKARRGRVVRGAHLLRLRGQARRREKNRRGARVYHWQESEEGYLAEDYKLDYACP